MILLVIAGCNKKTDEPEPAPDPDPVPPVVEPQDPVVQATPDDIIAWLNGNWLQITNSEYTGKTVSLTFDADSKTVKIRRSDGEYIVSELELFSTYEDPKISNDALRLKFKEASKYFTDNFGTKDYLYQSDMQYFVGSFEDQDYLFLRELGNGFSVTDSDAMGDFDSMAGDYGWFFIREGTGNSFPTTDENEQFKIKEDKFYAYCWGRGDTYLLQKVDVLEQEEEWYEGSKFNTLRVIPADGDYKYTAFLYGGESMPNELRPGLVKVSVSNGAIYSLKEVAYLGYGAYSAD